MDSKIAYVLDMHRNYINFRLRLVNKEYNIFTSVKSFKVYLEDYNIHDGQWFSGEDIWTTEKLLQLATEIGIDINL